MIEALHAFGLWLGGVHLLGMALPLWALLAGGIALLALPRALERLQQGLGALLSVLTPVVVLLCFGLVAARYGFGVGSIAVQEAMLWLHALIFMLGAAFALRCDRHVRVDVLHARLSERAQARIEAFGQIVLLLPFAGFMLWISLDYVAASWAMRESSHEPGGLPGVFLLKALIPLTAWLLLLQGATLAIAALKAVWRGGRLA
jgi:TRAP-type mannitol/chloroaromatic compound transport system permease small subunit